MNRDECPSFSPDPTLPISSFPITYDIKFPDVDCTPEGSFNTVRGDVELVMEGVVGEDIGTKATIRFKNNFKIC